MADYDDIVKQRINRKLDLKSNRIYQAFTYALFLVGVMSREEAVDLLLKKHELVDLIDKHDLLSAHY